MDNIFDDFLDNRFDDFLDDFLDKNFDDFLYKCFDDFLDNFFIYFCGFLYRSFTSVIEFLSKIISQFLLLLYNFLLCFTNNAFFNVQYLIVSVER